MRLMCKYYQEGGHVYMVCNSFLSYDMRSLKGPNGNDPTTDCNV